MNTTALIIILIAAAFGLGLLAEWRDMRREKRDAENGGDQWS